MSSRQQRTLANPAEVRGFGLFGGGDVALRFLPAPECHGIAFQRVDLAGQPRIPALIEYVVPTPRRTVIARGAARVEMIEHVMAALAGLHVDNCLIQIDAPEPPGMDGSSEPFVTALLDARIVPQRARRRVCRVQALDQVADPQGTAQIDVAPAPDDGYQIRFELDYPSPSVGKQTVEIDLTPESFVTEICSARTFILASEAAAMQAQGFGRRATHQNLLVLGPDGPIDNSFHTTDECARHKILDCIGDFALLGCDLVGSFHAVQSGHALNHAVVRTLDRLLRQHPLQRAAG